MQATRMICTRLRNNCFPKSQNQGDISLVSAPSHEVRRPISSLNVVFGNDTKLQQDTGVYFNMWCECSPTQSKNVNIFL